VGLGMGYLTLRLRGAFFAIATLALAVVLQTLVVNWNYVGGARGAYVIRPAEVAGLSLPYIQYLFLIMLALAVLAIATARIIEDVDERRELLPAVARVWKRNDVDRMVEQSPLIEVLLDSSEN